MDDPIKTFGRFLYDAPAMAPVFSVLWFLLSNIHWIYAAGLAVELFQKRKFSEALWWPVRTAIKVTVWIGKMVPQLKDTMLDVKKKLEDIHKPE